VLVLASGHGLVLISAVKWYFAPENAYFDLELAFTPQLAKKIVALWSPRDRVQFAAGLGVDVGVILCYTVMLIFLCARYQNQDNVDEIVDVATMQILAGVFHLGLNWFLLQVVLSFPNDMTLADTIGAGVLFVFRGAILGLMLGYLAYKECVVWVTRAEDPRQRLTVTRRATAEVNT
jgi:hypothetical protein